MSSLSTHGRGPFDLQFGPNARVPETYTDLLSLPITTALGRLGRILVASAPPMPSESTVVTPPPPPCPRRVKPPRPPPPKPPPPGSEIPRPRLSRLLGSAVRIASTIPLSATNIVFASAL